MGKWALMLAGLLLAGGSTQPVYAWGKNGHRIVAEIADDNLSGEARARIEQILGRELLEDAANWPDEMRSSPDDYWQHEAGPYHYVTVPMGSTYSDTVPPTEGDALTALAGFRATLRDPSAPLEDRRHALRFALHIIGDLHQPLHAGNGTDRGGNAVSVEFMGRTINLHSVWDTHMIEYQELSYTEYADFLGRYLDPDHVIAWWKTDPLVWVGESTELRDRIYPSEPEIGYDYIFAHQDDLNRRLAMGGVRAAAWLNEVFRSDGAAH